MIRLWNISNRPLLIDGCSIEPGTHADVDASILLDFPYPVSEVLWGAHLNKELPSESAETNTEMKISELATATKKELLEWASLYKVPGCNKMKKVELRQILLEILNGN